MDELTKKYIEMIFYTYVIRFVCAVGIFGNIAILVVLSRRGAKETAFVYIRALAAVDLIICVSLLGMGFVRCGDCGYLSPASRYWGKIYEGFVYLPIANAGQMSNLFITMTMAIHRVASVIQIRKASHDGCALRINVRRSRKMARRLVIIIILCSGSINVLRFFFYTIQEIPDEAPLQSEKSAKMHDETTLLPVLRELANFGEPGIVLPNQAATAPSLPQGTPWYSSQEFLYFPGNNSTTRTTMISGDGGEDRGPREWELVGQTTAGGLERDVRYKLEETDLYRASTDLYLYALSGLHFTELLILTTVNLILIRILKNNKGQRKNLIRGEVQKRERREGDDVTRMLVITVLVHIVCHLHSPFSAPMIAQQFFGKQYIESHAYKIQLAVNNTLTLTSHAITFFLYLVSRKFRKQCRRTWDCLLHHVFKTRRALHSPTPNHSWTPSYLKGGASPILQRQSSGTIRFL